MVLIMNTLGTVYPFSGPLSVVFCTGWLCSFLEMRDISPSEKFYYLVDQLATLDVDVHLIICWKQKVISKYWKQIFQMLAGTIRAK